MLLEATRSRASLSRSGLGRDAGYCGGVPRCSARRFFSCCRRRSASISTSCGSRSFFSRSRRSRPKVQSLSSRSASCSTKFEVDLGAVLFHDLAGGLPRRCPRPSFSSCCSWPRTCSKPLIDVVEDFVEPQLSNAVLAKALALCCPGVCTAFGAARFSNVNDCRRTETNLYRIFTTAFQPQNICKVESLEALWRA